MNINRHVSRNIENYLQFRPYDADIIPIKQDFDGIIVEEMERVLKERKRKMLPIPKVSI